MQNKIILKAYKNKNYIHKQIEQGILIFFNCDSSKPINRTKSNQTKYHLFNLVSFFKTVENRIKLN
jgi:hypothetical protein